MTDEVLIKVSHLQKSFNGGRNVLEDISIDIRRGEKIVIIGPSGCGKSTFLRCLNMLETPTGGSITFEGTVLTDPKTDLDKCRQKMGMVFQHFNLFPHLTIMQNLTLAPVTLGLKSEEEAKKIALELLKRVGLEDKAEKYPSRYP